MNGGEKLGKWTFSPRMQLETHSEVRSKTPPEGCSVFLSYASSMGKTAIEHPRVPFSNASLSR